MKQTILNVQSIMADSDLIGIWKVRDQEVPIKSTRRRLNTKQKSKLGHYFLMIFKLT